MKRIFIVLAILCASVTAQAQHILQVDDGAGAYGIINGSGLPVGVTVFTLPPLGGTLVTTGSLAGNFWLTSGNTLTGGAPTTPVEFFGSNNNYDVVMIANGATKLRLISGGGVWASMSNLSGSTDLVVSNAGVLQTRTVTSLGMAAGNEPFITFAADLGSLTNNRVLAVGTGLSLVTGGADNSNTTLDANIQTNATLLGIGTSGNQLRFNLNNPNTWTATQTFADVTINGNLDMTGGNINNVVNLANGAGDVTVGDNLIVTGTSDLRGNVFNSTGTNVVVNDGLVSLLGNTINPLDGVSIGISGNGLLWVTNSGGYAATVANNDVGVGTSNGLLVKTLNTATSRILTVASGTLTNTGTDRFIVYGNGNVHITGLTAGSALFAGASGLISQDNANFFFDDANDRLGLGDNTPDARLDIVEGGAVSALQVTNTGSASTATFTTNNGANANIGVTYDYNGTNHALRSRIGAGAGIVPAAMSALFGDASGSNTGVIGTSASGDGVQGFSTSGSGVYGLSSGAGVGAVMGRNDNATGYGINGYSTAGSAARFQTLGGAARSVYIDDASSGDALEINNTAGGLGIDLNGGALDGDAAANFLGDGANATQLTIRGIAGVGAYELVVTGDANITGATDIDGNLNVDGTSTLVGVVDAQAAGNTLGNGANAEQLEIQGVNGGAVELDVNGDADISGDLYLSAFTPGSVLFTGASGLVTQDNTNFFYDNTNDRLGLGDNTPDARLDVEVTSGSAVDVTSTGLGTVATITQNNAASAAPALQITTNTTFHGINLIKSGGSGFATASSGIVGSVAGTSIGVSGLSADGWGVQGFSNTGLGVVGSSNTGSAGRFITAGGAARTVYIEDASTGDALEINNTAGGLGIDLNGGALDGDAAANFLGSGANATQLTIRGVAGLGAYELVVTGDANITGATDIDGNLNVDGTSTLVGVVDAQAAGNTIGNGANAEQLEIQGVAGVGAYELDVIGDANITGQTRTGTLVVTGTSDLQGAVANSTGNLNLNDNVDIQGDLDMTLGNMNNVGNITQVGNVSITNTTLNVRINDNLEILAGNDLLFDGATADISNAGGDVVVNDNLDIVGVLDAQSAGNTIGDGLNAQQLQILGIEGGTAELDIIGDLDMSGNFDVNAGDFTIDGTNGNVSTNGTLNVVSTSTFGDDITIAGNVLPNGARTLGVDGNRWAEAYILGGSVHIGGNGGEAANTEMNLGYAGGIGTIKVNGTINPEVQIDGAANIITLDPDGDGTLNAALSTSGLSVNTGVGNDVRLSQDGLRRLGAGPETFTFETETGPGDMNITIRGDLDLTDDATLRDAVTITDFATAGVVHNDASGLLSTSLIVNSDITNSTIDLTTKVTGILPVANGGTGVDASTITNGQILIGHDANNNFSLATLTAGANVTITNSAGGITINAAAGTGSLIQVVHKLADESVNNSAVLQVDNHLTFPVDAGTDVEFSGILYVVNPTSNVPNFKCNLQAVGGNVNIKSAFTSANENNGASEGAAVIKVTAGAVTNTPKFDVGNNIITMITFKGIVSNTGGTDVDVTLWWAQDSAHGSNTTVEADSYLTYVVL